MMNALGRGLSFTQAIVWAYGTGQLCATQPMVQMEGSVDHVKEILRLELSEDEEAVEQLSEPLQGGVSGGAGPFAEGTFLRQTELHLAALLSSPSRLPKLRVDLEAAAGEEGEISLTELAKQLNARDSFGFTRSSARTTFLTSSRAKPRKTVSSAAVSSIGYSRRARLSPPCTTAWMRCDATRSSARRWRHCVSRSRQRRRPATLRAQNPPISSGILFRRR